MAKATDISAAPEPVRSLPANLFGSQETSDLLDEDAIRRAVEQVLNDPIYWFPVRHHSASVALHLEAAILARKPKLILIEGPFESNDLIPMMVDRETIPPVAIYSCFRDDQFQILPKPAEAEADVASTTHDESTDVAARFACWFPFLEYSPEFVAMQTAKKIGAKVLFMDLPHYALVGHAADTLAVLNKEPTVVDNKESGFDASDEIGEEDSAPNVEKEQQHEDKSPGGFDQSERAMASSDFYQALATAAGYQSWHEGWDSLFEFRDFDDYEAFRYELLAFCAAARATSPIQLVQADETLPRERFMMQTIRQSIEQNQVKADQTMVICGGFHAFLDRDDPIPPPDIPAGTVYTTIVPYSYFRTSELSGYGAGNRAPQFYQMHWQHQRGKLNDLLAEYVVAVLKRGRKSGEALSSADAISTTQHARMLSALRGRSRPVLDDIHDALITCCCKGDPQQQGVQLLAAMDDAAIGNRVGKVSSNVPRLPIVDDFYSQLARLDLTEISAREKKQQRQLDKRESAEFELSVFFHRLHFLKIPLVELTELPSTDFTSGTIFRERWALRWSPDVEAALIEQNLLGDSIESAAVAQLRKELANDAHNAGHVCRRLLEAIDMHLPNLTRELQTTCATAIDLDERFVSLSAALAHLTVLDRYAVHRELDRAVLDDLIVRCFHRSCFAIPDIVAVPEQEQAAVVQALITLADLVLKGDRSKLDQNLFREYVTAAAAETEIPFLRGAMLGVLVEIKAVPAACLAEEILSLSQAAQEKMIAAGDLIDGMLAASRTSILIGADQLIGAIDQLLRAAEWEIFMIMLPRMRAAFERLHARQRDSLAATVAELYGLKESETLSRLDVSLDAAARIAVVDQQVAEIMRRWQFV
jgi:hypothetical protein